MPEVPVHECFSNAEIEVVLSVLEAHGIRAATSSLASRSVHPFTVDGMGKTTIIVDEADAARARELLKDWQYGDPDEPAE